MHKSIQNVVKTRGESFFSNSFHTTIGGAGLKQLHSWFLKTSWRVPDFRFFWGRVGCVLLNAAVLAASFFPKLNATPSRTFFGISSCISRWMETIVFFFESLTLGL